MQLVSERLLLRAVNEIDVGQILKIRSNPQINQFIDRISPKNNFESLEFILNILRKAKEGKILFLGIAFKDQPQIMGTICLWKFSEDRMKAELGYEILPEFHRQGIMFEAIQTVLNYAFTYLNLELIDAFTHKNNIASIKLLQKSNFKLNENRKDSKHPENLIFEIKKNKFEV